MSRLLGFTECDREAAIFAHCISSTGQSPFTCGSIRRHKNMGYPDGVSHILVPVTGLEPVRCRQRWILSPLRLPFHHTGRCLTLCLRGEACPVAVPDIFLGFEKPSSAVDRCHSLSSLLLPPAALASLPITPAGANIVYTIFPKIASRKFRIPISICPAARRLDKPEF